MNEVFSNRASLIGVDWGSTNRRGFLLDSNGSILDSKEDGLGLLNISDGKFLEAFEALTAVWMEKCGPLPSLLSGMVGASTGWTEAKYCTLPAGVEDLAENLQIVPGCKSVWIVPGVMTHDHSKIPDVIRGEEVQAMSFSLDFEKHLFVLPGTHSKWLQTQNGQINWFSTFMTGDLYAAVLDHTVVSQLHVKEDTASMDAFELGIQTGYSEHENMLHLLFGARTKVLFNELKQTEVSDYLSGLLIGMEISSALSTIGIPSSGVELIGDEGLCERYHRALQICGIDACRSDNSRIGTTYVKIAQKAGIIRNTA